MEVIKASCRCDAGVTQVRCVRCRRDVCDTGVMCAGVLCAIRV